METGHVDRIRRHEMGTENRDRTWRQITERSKATEYEDMTQGLNREKGHVDLGTEH